MLHWDHRISWLVFWYSISNLILKPTSWAVCMAFEGTNYHNRISLLFWRGRSSRNLFWNPSSPLWATVEEEVWSLSPFYFPPLISLLCSSQCPPLLCAHCTTMVSVLHAPSYLHFLLIHKLAWLSSSILPQSISMVSNLVPSFGLWRFIDHVVLIWCPPKLYLLIIGLTATVVWLLSGSFDWVFFTACFIVVERLFACQSCYFVSCYVYGTFVSTNNNLWRSQFS